jgi:hypothetical protein
VSDPKQRMEALQRANQVRMKGSHWKMELRAKPLAAGIVSGMKPIRALTARQRWALAGALAAMGDRAREDVAA